VTSGFIFEGICCVREGTVSEEKPKFQVTDKRFWVNDENMLERAEVPQERYPSFVEELKARTEAAEQKLKERLAALESENQAFRERLDRRMQDEVERRTAEVISDLLEVLDNLELALEAAVEGMDGKSLREGVELCARLFRTKLAAYGVEVLELDGRPFDPQVAEAVAVSPVDDSAKDSVVLETVQRGYRIGERVLRPARVRVGRYQPV
jgi:molecular chaperone GrpE